jgi:hypothetical protein
VIDSPLSQAVADRQARLTAADDHDRVVRTGHLHRTGPVRPILQGTRFGHGVLHLPATREEHLNVALLPIEVIRNKTG